MSRVAVEIRHPIAFVFAAYACAHAALFSLVALLVLPMPALIWALGGLPLGWVAAIWMVRCGRKDLADLVGIQTVAFSASVLGVHAQQLQCFIRAVFI